MVSSWLVILIAVVQILMGITLTFGMFILTTMRDELKHMGEVFEKLQREVLKESLSEEVFETYRKETREVIHRLREQMVAYEQRLYELKVGRETH